MTASTRAPVLSIVLTAQQVAADDFDRRVLAPLRFNHEQLSAHGVSHEFVLVVGDAVWRADLAAAIAMLSETMSVLAVDPRYGDAFRVDGSDSRELIARNAGIRRARGTFILSTGCCVCIGRRVLRRMADRTLESGILYRAPRVDIRVDPSPDPLSWGTLEQPRGVIGRAKALQPPMYLGDAADFILLDRESLSPAQRIQRDTRVQRRQCGRVRRESARQRASHPEPRGTGLSHPSQIDHPTTRAGERRPCSRRNSRLGRRAHVP